jgi:hypothetical protein
MMELPGSLNDKKQEENRERYLKYKAKSKYLEYLKEVRLFL